MKIVVIIARCMNPGFMGCYGNEWVATPTLDQVSAEGVVFDQHLINGPENHAFQQSWRTGCHSLPGVMEKNSTSVQKSDLLQLLGQAGVASCIIHQKSGEVLDERGWDEAVIVDGDETKESQLRETFAKCLEKLARWKKVRDAFMWVNLRTLVPPWNFSDKFRQKSFDPEEASFVAEANEADFAEEAEETFGSLQKSYATALTCLDSTLGEFFEGLEKSPARSETVVFITSDRGMPLGEHGTVGNRRSWLHEELVHIPLIIRLPGQCEGGRRIPAITQQIDMPATILDLFGLPNGFFRGQSLIPLIEGKLKEIRPYACLGSQRDGEIEWATRTLDWYYILPRPLEGCISQRKAQLFKKPEDRWEVNNVLHHHSEWGERLERVTREFADLSARFTNFPLPDLHKETVLTNPY